MLEKLKLAAAKQTHLKLIVTGAQNPTSFHFSFHDCAVLNRLFGRSGQDLPCKNDAASTPRLAGTQSGALYLGQNRVLLKKLLLARVYSIIYQSSMQTLCWLAKLQNPVQCLSFDKRGSSSINYG